MNVLRHPNGKAVLMLGAGLLLAAASPARAAQDKAVPAKELALEESLKKARAKDKYAMLLRQVKVPKDREEFGEFRDVGYRNRTEYAGFTGLPADHWVYVAPYWYIW